MTLRHTLQARNDNNELDSPVLGTGHAYQGRDDRVGGWRKIPPTPFTKGVRKGGMTGGGGDDRKEPILFRPIAGSGFCDAKMFLIFFLLQFDMDCDPEVSRNTPQHT